MRLAGTSVLLTGASSGIGAATATVLAGRGARLLLTGRDTAALADIATQTGGDPLAADLTQPEATNELADWARRTAGGADVLVCNAGLGWAGSLPDMPVTMIDELITANLTAHLRLTALLLPHMVRCGRGHLVFVSSIAGSMGVAEEAVYSATKAALRVFADSVRLETTGSGVGVSVVMPGVVDTAFFHRRGRPYHRHRPRPVPANMVAEAVAGAIERNLPEVFVPNWLRWPARLNGALPGLTRALQRRFG